MRSSEVFCVAKIVGWWNLGVVGVCESEVGFCSDDVQGRAGLGFSLRKTRQA